MLPMEYCSVLFDDIKLCQSLGKLSRAIAFHVTHAHIHTKVMWLSSFAHLDLD